MRGRTFLRGDTVLKQCVRISAMGEKNEENPLYIFLNSLFHKQGMLGVYHVYNRDTARIQRGYNAGIR